MSPETFDTMTLSSEGKSSSNQIPESLVKKTDSKGRMYATGKRKTSIARVWVMPGTGKIEVNGKTKDAYFQRIALKERLLDPLRVLGAEKQFDVLATVLGGGVSSQVDAVRFGLSRALSYLSADYRSSLKPHGLLSRDARIVERKKPGRRKARRSFQFSKR